MKIITCKEYNAEQSEKYHKRCKEWKPEQGGFPQIAFCFFYDEKGNRHEDGFVAMNEKTHIWSKTRLGVLRKFNKSVN